MAAVVAPLVGTAISAYIGISPALAIGAVINLLGFVLFAQNKPAGNADEAVT
jgi:hypothetical protein